MLKKTAFVCLVASLSSFSMFLPVKANSAPPEKPYSISWLISDAALRMLANDPLAIRELDAPSTIVIVRPKSRWLPAGFEGRLAQSFPSAVAISEAIKAHALVKGVWGVAFDDEAWPLTPAAERENPAAAVEAARKAVHAAGLAYLQFGNLPVDGSPMGGAEHAQAIDIQAQGKERDVSAYAAYVKAEAFQARIFNPKVEVFAGLSTNPRGSPVTAGELYEDVLATRSYVNGYWLNIPSPGEACPRCNPPDPQVAEDMFAMLFPTAKSASGASQVGSSDAKRIWILAASHIAQVAANPKARSVLAPGIVYEPVSAREKPYTQLDALPTAVFHSYAELAYAVSHREIPADTKAILYDNERFANTPKAEQADPGLYDARAAALAKAHGWISICDFVEPDRLPKNERDPAHEVPPCSIIGLNTVQQSERDASLYEAKVSAEVKAIRSVRPYTPILAGLSSNPAGGPVTSAELAADMKATWNVVSGYWLNVPAPGVGCPNCGTPDPGVMAQALQYLAEK